MATYTSNYAWTKPSGGDPVDIEVLNDNLDNQDSIVHQAFLDLAPVFSTENTYAVKDVVLYDNKVWICHTAVTTAGAWTGSTNWTQTTVGETGGVARYADLPDKPSINGNELSGNKTGAQLGLQNTLTFDNVPTANSTNPVKSGGVYSADEAIRQWTTAEAKSVSGNPITLADGSARKAEGLAVTCNPKQNLHGYDHPWAGGAGKNKLPLVLADIKSWNTSGTWSGNAYTLNGVTFTVLTDDDDNVTGVNVNAPNNPSVNTVFNLAGYRYLLSLNGQSVILSGCVSNGSLDTTYLQFYLSDGEGGNISDIGAGSESFTPNVINSSAMVRIIVKKAISNAMFYPMIRLASVSDATFAPYSNECPITGYTECVVDVKDEDETTQATATIAFGQTVYGAIVNPKTGKATVTHASIASYNGESINEPWLSSIDEYVSGTTPTTGSQVVYPLTTPIELTLTPAELELLKGYNYITTNGTTIALDYLPDSLLAEAENYVDAKIPPAPTTDGTYVLTCTVTDGTPAYSWESAT